MRLLLFILLASCTIIANAQQSSLTGYTINTKGSALPDYLTVAHNRLYFAANDTEQYNRLWYLDINNNIIMPPLGPFYYYMHIPFKKHDIINGAQNTLFLSYTAIPGHGSTHNNLGGLSVFDSTTSSITNINPSTMSAGAYRTFMHKDTGIIFIAIGPATTPYAKIVMSRIDKSGVRTADTLFDDYRCYSFKSSGKYGYYWGEFGLNGVMTMRLYQIDMVTNTATLLRNNIEHSYNLTYNNKVTIGNDIYFTFQDANNGNEIYTHSGTGPIKMLPELMPGKSSSITANTNNILYAFQNKLYFSGEDSNGFGRLFEYDPTTNKTRNIHNPWHPHSFWPSNFIEYHNKLYFSAYDSVNGIELYVYDGTNPPYLAVDALPGSLGSAPHNLAIYDDDLFFAGLFPNNTVQLYRYNDSSLKVPVFPISVQDVGQTLTTTLYPNPTTGDAQLEFTLDKSQTLSVRVTEINGRVVYSNEKELYSAGGHKVTLPIKTLPPAAYIFTIIDGNGTVVNTANLIKR